MAMAQAIDHADLDEDSSGGGGEKYLDLEYIVEVEQAEFANRSDVGCGRNRGVKVDSKFFFLNDKSVSSLRR